MATKEIVIGDVSLGQFDECHTVKINCLCEGANPPIEVTVLDALGAPVTHTTDYTDLSIDCANDLTIGGDDKGVASEYIDPKCPFC